MDTRSKFLAITIWLLSYGIASDSHRILSDSILDIINTKHVEKILAERRLNASRQNDDARKQFITQNDLDEDITESDPDIYHTPEVVDFEFNNPPIRRPSPALRGDIVMQYNDTTPTSLSSSSSTSTGSGSPSYLNNFPNLTPEMIAELEAYRGDKVLKSSKSALVITRKEYLKKDWCKTEPLVQRIREEGCLTRTIINRFCYGQCNSFYIPKSPRRRRNPKAHHKRNHHNGDFEDEDLTGAAFKSCAFCKPKKFTWVTVTLRCPALTPQIRRKRIQRIKQCKCIAEPLN